MNIDLRCGRWQDVLADVGTADHLIADPPYGARTHEGQRHGRKDARYCDSSVNPLLSARGIPYAGWSQSDVHEFVCSWSTRIKGWFCAFASHDLVGHYTEALELTGRYVFAPVACVQHGMNVRLAGDGPSNWTTYLIVSRWPGAVRSGALPGAYHGPPHDVGENSLDRSKRAVPGGKPLWLMAAIVRDYTKAGDLIVDPCAGGATTLIAASMHGRRAVGAEMDPATFAKARARIGAGLTPDMFAGGAA